MSLPPEFGFHPSGKPNSGGRLIWIHTEAYRLEAGGLYPENGKSSIVMENIMMFGRSHVSRLVNRFSAIVSDRPFAESSASK
jgi:hypothetical protein